MNKLKQDDYIMVSYATKDGKYDVYGKKWEKNMKELGIKYDIEYVDPVKPNLPNSRLKNYKRQKKDNSRNIKGNFIQKKLKEHNKTIIWMDCDDGLVNKPVLMKDNYDVGFVDSEVKSLDVMSRIIVLKPTDNCFHFLKVWNYLNKWPELEPIGGDHKRLCFARYICFIKNGDNPYKFNMKNFTNEFNRCLKINMHK